MTRPSTNKYEAFEFDERDELVELGNHKFRSQFLNPKINTTTTKIFPDDSPMNKYSFLQRVAGGDQDYRGESVNVGAEVSQKTKSQEEDCTELLDIDESDKSSKRENTAMAWKLEDGPLKVEILNAQSSSTSSSCKTEPVGTLSSESSSTEATCSETSTFCNAGTQVPLEKQLTEPDSGGCEIDEEKMTVKIFPSIILYQDVPIQASSLTFSCNGIKLEGLTLKATFCSEWTVNDIMNIKSEWTASVNTAMVIIYLRSDNFKAGNANRTSGVEQLKFSFYDPNWAKGQEAIKTLDVRYNDLWNSDSDIDMLKGGKELVGQISMPSPNQYVSGSAEPFEDVIYPRGDPDAIIISKRDIERLKPETFLNDTIIDFYIKYLANNIQSKEKQRFHFFNSFFFQKLADFNKDPSSTVAFQRVRKWTRRINLFEKDYIFIPVNYSLHWSLLVICFPGEVPNSKDEEYETISKVPCILHMDSIQGSHKGLDDLIQRYLCEEWKDRHSGTAADASSKFLTLRFVPLELPQQENLFDCGLFLLHYLERFLEEAPLNFSPFNISKFSNFLSINWFPPQEASLKRYLIKKLIHKICEDHPQKAPSANRYPYQVLNRVDDQEAEVIVLEQVDGSTKTCRGISSDFNTEKVGIPLSKSRGDRCFKESGFVTSELFEPGACSWSNTDADNLLSPSNCSNYMSPIQEAEEIVEQVPESPLDMEDCEEVADSETLGRHEVSMQCRRFDKENFVSETSCGSPNLLWVGVEVNKKLPETEGSDHHSEPYKEESSSTLWKDFSDCVVKDSEDEEDSGHDSNEVRYIRFTRIENIFCHKKDRSAEKINPKGKSRLRNRDDAMLGSNEVQTSKRRRFVQSEGRRLIR